MLFGGYWKKIFKKISIHIFIDKFFSDKINILQTWILFYSKKIDQNLINLSTFLIKLMS